MPWTMSRTFDRSKMSIQLDEFLTQCLSDIDAVLARRSTPLLQRAYHAAVFMVQHCLIEIEGGTKDNFLQQPWFAALFQGVTEWYDDRYGDALAMGGDHTSNAAALAFGTPFQAKVPLTISEPPLSDGTFKVCFPREVFPTEAPLSWIVHPPKFDGPGTPEFDDVCATLIETATHLRVCHVDLMTAVHKDERSRKFSTGVVPQLEKGARDLVRAEPHSLSSAMWELNFAGEKSIKAFLAQQGIAFGNIHDVHRLHDIAVDHSGIHECDSAASCFPSGQEAVKHRYAELPTPTPAKVFSIYRAALRIASHYSHRLDRKFSLNNAVFHFRRPPWLEGSPEGFVKRDAGPRM